MGISLVPMGVPQITAETFEDGLAMFLITGEESNTPDYKRIDDFMELLHKIGKVACQGVGLGFSGYDDDPREIWEIPEARAFIQRLNDKHPCWPYFVIPEQEALFACLLPMISTRGAMREDAIRILRKIKDEIRAYGKEIGDPVGAQEAVSAWRQACRP